MYMSRDPKQRINFYELHVDIVGAEIVNKKHRFHETCIFSNFCLTMEF